MKHNVYTVHVSAGAGWNCWSGGVDVGVSSSVKRRREKWSCLRHVTTLAGYKPNNDLMADVGTHGKTAVIHVFAGAG